MLTLAPAKCVRARCSGKKQRRAKRKKTRLRRSVTREAHNGARVRLAFRAAFAVYITRNMDYVHTGIDCVFFRRARAHVKLHIRLRKELLRALQQRTDILYVHYSHSLYCMFQ